MSRKTRGKAAYVEAPGHSNIIRGKEESKRMIEVSSRKIIDKHEDVALQIKSPLSGDSNRDRKRRSCTQRRTRYPEEPQFSSAWRDRKASVAAISRATCFWAPVPVPLTTPSTKWKIQFHIAQLRAVYSLLAWLVQVGA